MHFLAELSDTRPSSLSNVAVNAETDSVFMLNQASDFLIIGTRYSINIACFVICEYPIMVLLYLFRGSFLFIMTAQRKQPVGFYYVFNLIKSCSTHCCIFEIPFDVPLSEAVCTCLVVREGAWTVIRRFP